MKHESRSGDECELNQAGRAIDKISDEGNALTDGNVVTQCTDAESAEGWKEIDAPGEDSEEVIAAVDEAIGILRGEEEG